ncbi:hypothetical protein HYH03_017140 [Edaphochlamys debaryana]|uniref:Pherophorin domain-containing protein n=1 Tax=Edaphochlamys debaryana TaxID=47281 RepID=A0A835XIJ9_9CHLO|nr:hypothetical protein HYH03_017140 [Edaphochlamys debaryana]|eukprot:KAG2484050.1 hypothetical protein HYH03_017140 [Edaphochlamys debaryana]
MSLRPLAMLLAALSLAVAVSAQPPLYGGNPPPLHPYWPSGGNAPPSYGGPIVPLASPPPRPRAPVDPYAPPIPAVPSEHVGSLLNIFPFCACKKRQPRISPYVLYAVEPTKTGKIMSYCWSISTRVPPRDSACADMDLSKIQMLIKPECVAESPKAIVKASINGIIFYPTYTTFKAYGEEAGVLSLSKLSSKVSAAQLASGVVDVCLYFDTSRKGCNTLEKLCDGGDYGCKMTFFNTGNTCCPTTDVLFYGQDQ